MTSMPKKPAKAKKMPETRNAIVINGFDTVKADIIKKIADTVIRAEYNVK